MATFAHDIHDFNDFREVLARYASLPNDPRHAREIVVITIDEDATRTPNRYSKGRPLPDDDARRFAIDVRQNAVRRLRFVETSEMCPRGAYVARLKDDLFVVVPRVKTNELDERRVVADHYRFERDDEDAHGRVRAHARTFTPHPDSVHLGTDEKVVFDLANGTDETETTKQAHTHDLTPEPEGTGHVLRRRPHDAEPNATKGPKERVQRRLETMLVREDATRVVAFAVRSGQGWDVTAFVDRREGRQGDGYAFRVRGVSSVSFQRELAVVMMNNFLIPK